MKPSKKGYAQRVKDVSPRSKTLQNVLCAFVAGGLVCTLGQLLRMGYEALGVVEKQAGVLCSLSLMFLAILLTGLGKFDDLARVGGAGLLVPITGFANAMSAPAMEFKTEGLILGLAANLFKIAGPVIVYGTVAAVVYGAGLAVFV